MVDRRSVFDAWGTESALYDQYTTEAAEKLVTDARLRDAQKEWLAFLGQSHGEVFDDVPFENPRDRLFVDMLYYDFLVDRILEYVQRQFDVRVRNSETATNTDALSIQFHSLHEIVTAGARIDCNVCERLEAEDLLRTDASFLRDLYESVISPPLRRQLGQYYTPRGVAEVALSELDIDDHESETILDPGCGAGVFLGAAIDTKREALEDELDPETLLARITDTVYGIDLNPVAVKSAKLTYLLSLLPTIANADIDQIELPVFLTDALQLTRDDTIRFGGESLVLTVDHLVGNPPWITWDDLSETARTAWQDGETDRLDLMPHRGIEARLGHANDDISVPFVWTAIDRYLAAGGDASFVLKRDITKGPAGRLLRSQQVADRPVAVRHIHDFNDLRPFGESVRTGVSVYTLCADSEPTVPIDGTSWTAGEASQSDFSSLDRMCEALTRDSTAIVPVDPDDIASSWIEATAEKRALGECRHEIRHGVKDDAKAVFSVDREQVVDLEHDHIYPYIRSKHVVKYGLFGHDLHLVPMEKAHADNEAELKAECPKTYEYLSANRETLKGRSSSWLQKGPFYTLFGLGEYTWSAYKVVWCRLGFKPHFAVVSTRHDEDLGEKTVIPGDHCMFISTDNRYEAHFLCGLLNSARYQQSLSEIASEGKSSLSKTVISKLELPEYEETPEGRRLAELSMAAHEVVPEHTDVSKRAYNERQIPELEFLQAEIDDCVQILQSDR